MSLVSALFQVVNSQLGTQPGFLFSFSKHILLVFRIRTKTLCPDQGLNQGPLDLQSNALLTELSSPLTSKHTKELRSPKVKKSGRSER